MEFAGVDPSHVRNLEWLRVALEHRAIKEMQPDSSRRVGMLDAEVFLINPDHQAELFADFTLECGLERFVRFHLAAREFPIARKVNVVETSCNKNFVRAANDCGNDCYGHERSSAAWRYGRKS